MINKNRVVSVKQTDLLTLYGTAMKLAGTSFTIATSSDIAGNYTITASGDAGNKLADQPVVSCDFASGTTAAVLYFVADYNYTGFKVAGTAVTTSGATVSPDCSTLYTATLSSGTITIAAVSPVAA